MEIDKVSELENKIGMLIERCISLKDENNTLKMKIDEIKREKEDLMQFKQDAISKVDKILSTLNEVSL